MEGGEMNMMDAVEKNLTNKAELAFKNWETVWTKGPESADAKANWEEVVEALSQEHSLATQDLYEAKYLHPVLLAKKERLTDALNTNWDGMMEDGSWKENHEALQQAFIETVNKIKDIESGLSANPEYKASVVDVENLKAKLASEAEGGSVYEANIVNMKNESDTDETMQKAA